MIIYVRCLQDKLIWDKNTQLISRSATNGNRKQISTLSLHYSGIDTGLEKAKLHLKFAEHAVNDRNSVQMTFQLFLLNCVIGYLTYLHAC